MHYFEEAQLTNNELQMVIYLHSDLSDIDEIDSHLYSPYINLELLSIQSCRYVQPYMLRDFLQTYKYTWPKEINLELDKFYLVTINFYGYSADVYKVVKVQEVHKDLPNYEFLCLH